MNNKSPDNPHTPSRPRLVVSTLTDVFGLSPFLASVVAAFMALLVIIGAIWVVRSAPPRTLTLSAGKPGSTFEHVAQSYQKLLAQHGVDLKILESEGSEQNLERLSSQNSTADIGFIQAGPGEPKASDPLVSLGSVSYQPILIFYRGTSRIERLSELAGRRIAIGAKGSGTHNLALTLLQANGIAGEPTTLLDLDAQEAAQNLTEGKVDAVFLMGDSAPAQTLRNLLRTGGIELYSFTQADAYVRRFPYLSQLVLPEGAIDFGKNLPSHDVVLIGPTVELVARKGLNSALSDLLIEIAQEVHGGASLMQKRGEFPSPIEHDFKVSDDALRYYKSGKGFTYRLVGSFWLASLLNRILVAFVPFVILLIPAIRFFPTAYRWLIRVRFFQSYRQLLRLEDQVFQSTTKEEVDRFLLHLDEIEETVNRLKVPASLADQFYSLRSHIALVRDRLGKLKTRRD